MIYWLLLSLFLLLFGIHKMSIRYGYHGNRILTGRKIYIMLAGGILVFIAGMRSTAVGMDTNMYQILFEYVKESNSLRQALTGWQRGGTEFGYVCLEFLISRTADFQIFLWISGVISIIPVMIAIYKYSKNYWMSIFLFVSFGYFSFFMNAVRQSLAMGICMLAFICARERKIIKFLVLVGAAALFHASAIIFLPVYWLNKIKLTRRTVLCYVFLVMIANLFKNQFFQLINIFSRQRYSAVNDAGGARMYLFMLATVFLIWFFKNQFLRDSNEKVLFYMLAISTLIWPVTSANTSVFRLYYFYHIFMIFSIPDFLESLSGWKERAALYGGFILIGCYYLQNYVIQSSLKYDPYLFFWQ